MSDINIGTQVHHRRHTFLVGRVTGVSINKDVATVMWDHQYGEEYVEAVSDLRITPYQPRTAVGSSSTVHDLV